MEDFVFTDAVAPEKPSSKYTGAAETTLAEILMSASSASALKGMFLKSKGLISSDELMLTTKAFIGWIMWGESLELMQDTRGSATRIAFEGLEYGIMSKRLVLESTIQLSWAHFEAARDILLLLTYILSVQGQVDSFMI